MADATRGQVSGTAAEVYEELFVPALFGQWGPVVVEAAGVRPGNRVLDVGCGTGATTRAAAAVAGARGHVAGVDANPGMLAVARRLRPDVDWHQGIAEALPFDDASFDSVVSSFALMFVDDGHAAASEMRRVLAPEGRVGVAVWAPLDACPGYAAMAAMLDRTVGSEAGDALRVPFRLGDPGVLDAVLRPAFPNVRTVQRTGVARFPDLDAWVRTEVRGWTFGELVDDDAEAALCVAARRDLAGFVGSDGGVVFDVSAVVATAGRS